MGSGWPMFSENILMLYQQDLQLGPYLVKWQLTNLLDWELGVVSARFTARSISCEMATGDRSRVAHISLLIILQNNYKVAQITRWSKFPIIYSKSFSGSSPPGHHFQCWDSSQLLFSGCGGTGSETESETKYERLDIFAANTTSPPYLWVFSLRVVYSMVGIALPLAGHLPCYFLLLSTH